MTSRISTWRFQEEITLCYPLRMIESLKDFIKRHSMLLAIAAFTLFLLRWCLNVIWWSLRSRAIRRYLDSHQIRKLHIGAGPNILEGWLNTDKYPTSSAVVFLNATRSFPFKNDTFDYIFSEHLIEHLTYAEGQGMLRECFRVLKPGGKMRVATPDLETLVGLCTREKSELQQRYVQWIIDTFLPGSDYHESFVINNAFFSWGHRFLYDRATLESALARAGFADIVRRSVGASEDDVFRGMESHGLASGDEEMNRFETMVLEAVRPL